jgi:pyruvate formate lyase activating enzyme
MALHLGASVVETVTTDGVLFDIKRYAIHDGPGIRVTLFMQGCPLHCWWCHNPESLRVTPDPELLKAVKRYSVEETLREIEKEVLFFDESGGGVTFSGGEPLIQHVYLKAVAEECRKRDIHTTLDTSGYAPGPVLESVMDSVDLFLYDLKLIDPIQHELYTGVSSERIIDNLRRLAANRKAVIIRFPLIPRITDTEENLLAMENLLLSFEGIRQICLLPYHQSAKEKYRTLRIEDKMKQIQPPSAEQIDCVKRRFERQGFRVQVGG